MGGARDQINDVINPIKYHRVAGGREQQCGRNPSGESGAFLSSFVSYFFRVAVDHHAASPRPVSLPPRLMDDANNCA